MILTITAIIVSGIVLFIVLFFVILKFVAVQPYSPCSTTPDSAGLPYENIAFESDGATIRGWLIKKTNLSKNEKSDFIIITHGWGSNASRMIPYARIFYESGFNVVLFSTRNQGNSGKSGYSSAYQFSRDINATVDYIKQEYPISSIMLFGHSMGASATILAISGDGRIEGGIACSAFADSLEMTKRALRWHKIPSFPFIWFFVKFFEWYHKISIMDVMPATQIRHISVPLLLIHGQEDKLVPISNLKTLEQNAPGKYVEVAVLPNLGHNKLYENKEFQNTLKQFIEAKLCDK